MTPILQARIHAVRKKIETWADPTVGFLAPPTQRHSFPVEVPKSYQEFLRESDGAACGVVILYESEGILQHQRDASGLPGGRDRWFCIGAVEDYPIVVHRQTNAVYLVPQEGRFDIDDSVGDLDYFLLTSVFGPDYADFVLDPDSDPWYRLVASFDPQS